MPLMNIGFAMLGSLTRNRRPLNSLSIGSRICSALLADPASRRRPCASLALHLHLVVKRTYTSPLSNLLGTPKKKGPEAMLPGLFLVASAFEILT
jgi:hypothetical protein